MVAVGHTLPNTKHDELADSHGPTVPWHRFGFEAYGVSIVLNIESPDLQERVEAILPPGWQPRDPRDEDAYFSLVRRDGVVYRVEYTTGDVSGSSDLDIALAVLESQLRAYVSLHSPDHIFVHAGVVGIDGRAIVIPGPSFGGKTTLVAELVRHGALYYSDEFAVLDHNGHVHPYPKPLSIRADGLNQKDHDVATFGGTIGEVPLPVRTVVVTQFVPEAEWRPERLSGGDAVLALLSNTVPAQERPAQALATINRALRNAVVLSGDRGEAAALVPELLERGVAPYLAASQ